MAKKAKLWFNKEISLFGRSKTLRELMAERGMDEYGRRTDHSPQAKPKTIRFAALPTEQPETSGTRSRGTKFVARFSYGTYREPLTVEVVEVKQWAFSGRSRLDNSWQSYSWSNVRGLIRVVDSGEMLTPIEVLDRYY